MSLVQFFVEVVVEAVSCASEDSSWSGVDCAFGEDVAGVSGKGVIPFGVEALLEAEEVAEQLLDGVFVVVWAEVHAPLFECFVEVAGDEGFGVVDGVGVGGGDAAVVSVSADEDGLVVEAAAHG